jgi:hypothetical protein
MRPIVTASHPVFGIDESVKGLREPVDDDVAVDVMTREFGWLGYV